MIRVRKQIRTGFTLIELLVVVSIIALLVSILLPSLNKAREQAKKVVCQTQLQQLGMGVYYYSEENNDFTPKGYSVGGWQTRLRDYVDNWGEGSVFDCPTTKGMYGGTTDYMWNDLLNVLAGTDKYVKLEKYREADIFMITDSKGGWYVLSGGDFV